MELEWVTFTKVYSQVCSCHSDDTSIKPPLIMNHWSDQGHSDLIRIRVNRAFNWCTKLGTIPAGCWVTIHQMQKVQHFATSFRQVFAQKPPRGPHCTILLGAPVHTIDLYNQPKFHQNQCCKDGSHSQKCIARPIQICLCSIIIMHIWSKVTGMQSVTYTRFDDQNR